MEKLEKNSFVAPPFGISLQDIDKRIDRIQQTLSDVRELLDRRDVRETLRPARESQKKTCSFSFSLNA